MANAFVPQRSKNVVDSVPPFPSKLLGPVEWTRRQLDLRRKRHVLHVQHAYDANFGDVPTLRIEALMWDRDGWPVSPSASAEG